jgi:hypothetical protein
MIGRRKKDTAAAPKSPKSPTKQNRGRAAWKLFDRAATTAAAFAAPKVSQVAWRTLSGRNPPKSGRHPDVAAKEAIAWAMVGGGLAEATKIAIRRAAATYWKRSTGSLPPGMKPVANHAPADGPTSASPQPRQSLQ